MHNVYFFTDVHGNYNLYCAIVEWCLCQDSQSTIIFGGDACDRGPYGFRIMEELLDCPQIVYLKGNHEDMFTAAAREILKYYNMDARLRARRKDLVDEIISECIENKDYKVSLAIANEGDMTLKDWIISGASEDIIKRIEGLPLTFSYDNLDFCHAGAEYEVFKRVADAEHDNGFAWGADKQDLLWDRSKIAFGWIAGRIGVFGHTPTVLLPDGIYGRDKSIARAHPCAWKDRMGAIGKRGGIKIDMDTGSIWSNRAYVLDCLTMEVYGFEDEVVAGGSIIKNIEPYKII